MSRIYLLPKEGNFYKANLHCHSTISDGRLSPEELKKRYKAQGYSILAYSDHNRLVPHTDLQDENFLPITTIEIDFNPHDSRSWTENPTYHLNFFSKNPNATEFIPFERVYDADVINGIIERAKESGFLAQYNHPRWSYQNGVDYLPLKGLFGFEMYNHGCEVEMLNGYGDYEYEQYCRSGNRCACVATDDNHNAVQESTSPLYDSFGGFTMIKAPTLSYGNVLNAMECGNCYASTKPLFHALYLEGDILHVECSPANCVAVLTDTRTTRVHRTQENEITAIDFKIDFPYQYLRVEISDTERHLAMTRAYYADEISSF